MDFTLYLKIQTTGLKWIEFHNNFIFKESSNFPLFHMEMLFFFSRQLTLWNNLQRHDCSMEKVTKNCLGSSRCLCLVERIKATYWSQRIFDCHCTGNGQFHGYNYSVSVCHYYFHHVCVRVRAFTLKIAEKSKTISTLLHFFLFTPVFYNIYLLFRVLFHLIALFFFL